MKLFKTLALTGGALVLAKGLDDRLEITRCVIRSSKLPDEFDNFVIAQISDFHADSVPGLIAEIEAEAPDIIVSTGDLVHDDGSFAAGVRLCERLLKIAPVYAVNGNHDVWRTDYGEFESELSAAGVVTIHDRRVMLKRNGAEIGLCGIDDPFSLDGAKIVEKVKASLSKIPPYDGYDILLFHRANMLDMLKSCGFDLIISGHMHGGQIRLPLLGGVAAPKSSWNSDRSAFFPKYFAGHYKYKSTDMIVSRGLGNPMLIPRLFNRPELMIITLKKDKTMKKGRKEER